MKNNRPEKNKFGIFVVKNCYFITIKNAEKKTAGLGNKCFEYHLPVYKSKEKK